MVRMSAEERRESVIRAAVVEFARGGYHGTSTEVVARRVGVSQPYLFRLFPSKQAIFLAASLRCCQEITEVFRRAAEGLEAEEALQAMGDAYRALIADDPDLLLMQMQMYVAVASAEAGGDREFGEALRAAWMEMYDTVLLAMGADADGTTQFLAYGMLINVLVSMGFRPDHRVWSGFYESAQPDGRVGREA
ncbi:TetR/AcrR family transcriptional regulator [Streptomyces sp. G44]|uniref:TetR/AcrR family transcriptional regulator n=1 Tax=Streptomyces sp. G44 TaxID=2807632 RepID=UPI00195FEE4D|nr:TetR/AcrR family transcriptional regulator [Streptomyces sp. G44]MBM7168130.1 TetR/AcrR family transcriptional regulator [Streptomyces sp. G44]